MNRLAVLGGGSWGTALTIALAPNFDEVGLWVRREEQARRIRERGRNEEYLPGFDLPSNLVCSADPEASVAEADVVITALPVQSTRSALSGLAKWINEDVPVVSASKGFECGSSLRVSDIIRNAIGRPTGNRILALSGPSFAREVAALQPTALVVAGELGAAVEIQRRFARPTLRIYTSTDLIGVELGGAVKNVIAIGAGMAEGLGLGQNALAALVTRGLAEMTRLAVTLGAEARTLAGLSGLGDLLLTCTSGQSRNRCFGKRLTERNAVENVPFTGDMTVEGFYSAGIAFRLGRERSLEMPIADAVCSVLERKLRPAEAIQILFKRNQKEE